MSYDVYCYRPSSDVPNAAEAQEMKKQWAKRYTARCKRETFAATLQWHSGPCAAC